MPKIYELPAQTGAEPGLMRGGPVTRAPFREQQQPPGSDDPIRMLTNQESMELNNVTRWFDSQTAILDQQQLDPDKHRAAYARLQSQATTQRTEVRAKHVTNAQQIKNMQKLVESGILAPEQMQATMLVMVGVPPAHIKAAFAQEKRQKPIARLRDLKFNAERISNWQSQFDFDKKDNLILVDKDSGKKLRGTSDDEKKAYEDADYRLWAIQEEMWGLYEEISPLEKLSMAGSRAVERFGGGRKRLDESKRRRTALQKQDWFSSELRLFPGSIHEEQLQEKRLQSEKKPTETEFLQTVERLKTTDLGKAKTYYNKWVKKIWRE